MDTGKYGASDDSVTVCLKFQYGGHKTESTGNSKIQMWYRWNFVGYNNAFEVAQIKYVIANISRCWPTPDIELATV